MSLNKAQLIGNLGRDAELKFLGDGTAVSTLNIATTEVWNEKDASGKPTGKKNEKTEWHRCVLWGKQAETLDQYLVKGKQVYVEGRLQTRNWEKDGQKHYTTEIRVDRITLLGGGSKNAGGGVPHPADAPGADSATEPTDADIPF